MSTLIFAFLNLQSKNSRFLFHSLVISHILTLQFKIFYETGEEMQHILRVTRKCIAEYKMIQEGDVIGVGVSGGKDSMLMLLALSELRKFYTVNFDIVAITVDPDPGKADYGEISEFCGRHNIKYSIVKSDIFDIVFNIRKEENPCSLCAKMRRGLFHDEAKRLGCNKIALGHNFNDAVETFLMSQIFEGRISCFSPVTYLDRKELWQIRPILYINEPTIRGAVRRFGIPTVKNPCPANGNTKRQEIKEHIQFMNSRYPGYERKVFGAMQRMPLDGWEILDANPRKSAKKLL